MMLGSNGDAVLPVFSSTIRVVVCDGDSVRVVDVRGGMLRARSRVIAVVGDPGDERACDAARARVVRAGRAGSVIVVLPAEQVHLRPMAMSSRLFADAKEELRQSVESLLPIDPSGAMLGFVDRRAEQTADPEDEVTGSGYLIGVEGEVVKRWSLLCEQLTGRKPDRVVAAHQALLGAGFQGAERALVRECGSYGEVQDSILEQGRIVELRIDEDPASEPDLVIGPARRAGEGSEADRLAIGAAMLGRCASDQTSPVSGEWTPGWKRAMPTVIAASLALALVLTASAIRDSRYEAELQAVLDRQQELRADVSAVGELVTARDRLRSKLRAADVGAIDRESSVLEIIGEVERAMPPDAFLEQFVADRAGVRLRGVAASARDVLAAIEASPRFGSVREGQRPQPVGDRSGREVFDIRAEFRAAAGGAS